MIAADSRMNDFLRQATVNNGSLVYEKNLSKLPHYFDLYNSLGIDYNYPYHILYTDLSTLLVHVMSVNRKQNYCQV
jgi:hypothetical protein